MDTNHRPRSLGRPASAGAFHSAIRGLVASAACGALVVARGLGVWVGPSAICLAASGGCVRAAARVLFPRTVTSVRGRARAGSTHRQRSFNRPASAGAFDCTFVGQPPRVGWWRRVGRLRRGPSVIAQTCDPVITRPPAAKLETTRQMDLAFFTFLIGIVLVTKFSTAFNDSYSSTGFKKPKFEFPIKRAQIDFWSIGFRRCVRGPTEINPQLPRNIVVAWTIIEFEHTKFSMFGVF